MHIGLKSVQDQDGCPHAVAERIDQLRTLALRMDDEVEHLSFELRPLALDDLGLGDALWRHLQEWSVLNNIEVDLHIQRLGHMRLPDFVETTIYRIVQEALTNIIKHAKATRVSLIVERRNGLLIIIEDNGRGFDLDAMLHAPSADRRLGLMGMRERAELAGGHLDIETESGSGTTIYLHLPLPTASTNGGSAANG